MLDGVFIECVCAHVVFRGEQTKTLAGNKPVKRTALATNCVSLSHDMLLLCLALAITGV